MQKGDVVEAVDLGLRQNDGMMVAVAAYESHHLGAVGEAKAQGLLVERGFRIDIGTVEINMGEAERPVSHFLPGLMLPVSMYEPQDAALWFRIVRTYRRQGCSSSSGPDKIVLRMPYNIIGDPVRSQAMRHGM